MLCRLHSASAVVELLVYCQHGFCRTFGEGSAVIPSVFDLLSAAHCGLPPRNHERGRRILTLAFFAILRAHSTAVVSPGMGISAVTGFAISSAMINASRGFMMSDERLGGFEWVREGALGDPGSSKSAGERTRTRGQ